MGVLQQLESFCRERVGITGPPLRGGLGDMHTHSKLDSWIGSRMEKKVELKPMCPSKPPETQDVSWKLPLRRSRWQRPEIMYFKICRALQGWKLEELHECIP